MKKIMFISFIGVSMLLVFIGLNSKSNYLKEDNILGIYLDNKLQEDIPKKGEAIFSKAVCDNNGTNFYWDIDKWGLFISNLSKKTKCNLYFVNYSGQTIFDFDYTGGEQTFTAPVSGTYRLETWGAQGHGWANSVSSIEGGVGGYSVGNISLKKNNALYIHVGKYGENNHEESHGPAGGGATSIKNELLNDGNLSNYKNDIDKIIIVSGGGGGSEWSLGQGGSGGGFIGGNGLRETSINVAGGTQNNGGKSVYYQNNNNSTKLYDGSFGLGGYTIGNDGGGQGGNGFYGGGASDYTYGGGGGSGYIGNSLLKDKVMYCYNCEESNEESTKTISTTCGEETPTSYCAKKGNGYTRITLVSIDEQ